MTVDTRAFHILVAMTFISDPKLKSILFVVTDFAHNSFQIDDVGTASVVVSRNKHRSTREEVH